jgi:predicted DNA-binding transcriptional regulator AlpA
MDLLSIPELAQQIGTADNTVRRYLKRFPEYFYHQTTGGVKRFPREAIDTLKFIFNQYNFHSKTKIEIKQELEKKYGNTIPIETPQAPINEIVSSNGSTTSLPAILPEISRLADSFERIAAALEKISRTGSAPAVMENQAIGNKELLSDKETAIFLGVATRTLREWRKQGKGPAFVKMGTKIKYRKTDIDLYLDNQTVSPEGLAHE